MPAHLPWDGLSRPCEHTWRPSSLPQAASLVRTFPWVPVLHLIIPARDLVLSLTPRFPSLPSGFPVLLPTVTALKPDPSSTIPPSQVLRSFYSLCTLPLLQPQAAVFQPPPCFPSSHSDYLSLFFQLR